MKMFNKMFSGKKQEKDLEKEELGKTIYKAKVNEKIVEQLPKWISLETFWKVVKFNENKQGGNTTYETGNLVDLKEGLYTDKIIEKTIEQLKTENVSKLLEEVDKGYKGGI